MRTDNPSPTRPLREPREGKMNIANTKETNKKPLYNFFWKKKNKPKRTGIKEDRNAPKEFGSLKVPLILPWFTQKGVLPKLEE